MKAWKYGEIKRSLLHSRPVGRKSSFLLKVATGGSDTPRLIMVVRKKIVKTAVMRNRIRRQIRAVFNQFIRSDRALTRDYIVILTRPTQEGQSTFRTVEALFQKTT